MIRRRPRSTVVPYTTLLRSQAMTKRLLAYSNQQAVEEKYINLTGVTVRASRKELTDRLNKKLSSAMFQSFDEQIDRKSHTSELQSRLYLVCRLLLERSTASL